MLRGRIVEEEEEEGTSRWLQKCISSTENKLSLVDSRLMTLEKDKASLLEENEWVVTRLKDLDQERMGTEEEHKVVALLSERDEEVLQELQDLVSTNENLKKHEHKFKTACKNELKELPKKNSVLRQKLAEEREDSTDLEEETDKSARARLAVLRLQLAKKTRTSDALERRLDDVPSSYELAQYQRGGIKKLYQISH